MAEDGCGREIAPAGLVVERIERTTAAVRVFARVHENDAACPSCGSVSRTQPV